MSYFMDNHYQCGPKKFYNIFQALEYQKQSGHFPKLHIDPQLTDSLKGFARPKNLSRDYIQGLMIQRLKQIRKKYNRFCVAYGGGTDSYTIVKLCVDNDIYIDETVTQMISLEKNIRGNLEYSAGIKIIKKYEGNQIGKISELHTKESDLDYSYDLNYVYDDRITPGNYHAYRPYSLPNMIQQHLRAGPDCAVVVGLEKPRFLYDNGHVYWTIDDFAIGEIMNVPHAIPFFLDKENPELVACMAFSFLDCINVSRHTKKNPWINFHRQSPSIKYKILDRCGFYPTKYHWINIGLLGKTLPLNRKNLRFWNELKKLGRTDYIDNIYKAHAMIKEKYKSIPYGIEELGHFTKSVGRLGKKIKITKQGFEK